MDKMKEWTDGTWGTTLNDRNDIRDFYGLYTIGDSFAPTISGGVVTFRWYDNTYAEKNYIIEIWKGVPDDGVADTHPYTIYSQADVADKGQVLLKAWTPAASDSGWYYAVIYPYNAIYEFGPSEDTTAVYVP
ncbi:MAG: hypothetical protein IT352_13985 [Gemmatimonadales bacterium]|nr:hypothetical protein [Gemmatimonadales bacterium]